MDASRARLRVEQLKAADTLGMMNISGIMDGAKVNSSVLGEASFLQQQPEVRRKMEGRAEYFKSQAARLLTEGKQFSLSEGDPSKTSGITIKGKIDGCDAQVTIPVDKVPVQTLSLIIAQNMGQFSADASKGARSLEATLSTPLMADVKAAEAAIDRLFQMEVKWDTSHTEKMKVFASPGKAEQTSWSGYSVRGGLEESITFNTPNDEKNKDGIDFSIRRRNRGNPDVDDNSDYLESRNGTLRWVTNIVYKNPAEKARNVSVEATSTANSGWRLNLKDGTTSTVAVPVMAGYGITEGGNQIPDVQKIVQNGNAVIPVALHEEQVITLSNDEVNLQGNELYLRAIARINQGGTQNIHEAISDLESLRAKFGNVSTLHSALALVHGRDGDYARCLQEYQEALRLDPKNGDAAIITPQPGEDGEATYDRLHHAGQELLKLGKPQEALRYYEAAVAIKGGGHLAPWSLFDKGVALSQLKHFEEAAQQLLDVRGLLPGNTWVDSRIGMVYEAWTSRAGNKAEAKSFYEAALAKDPTNAEAKEGLERVK